MGFALLCGGRSSRMGRCKALLDFRGGALYDIAARAGEPFAERLFSANDPAIPTPPGYTRVPDLRLGCGPMGGLHAVLSACRSPALVIAPCDAPFYTEEVALYLARRFPPDADALVLTDETGRAHPLMAAYGKSCLPAIAAKLDQGDYKLMRMLDGVRTVYERAPAALGEAVFRNLNTPEDLAALGGLGAGERT